MEEEDLEMYSSLSTVMMEENPWASRSRGKKSSQDADHTSRCPFCMDVAGRNGGLATLACGHTGCLGCLQRVRALAFWSQFEILFTFLHQVWLLRFPFFGSWDINSNLAQNVISIAGFIRGACLFPSVQQFSFFQYWNGSCRCKRAQGSPSVQLAANLSVRISALVQIMTSANRWVKGKKQRRTLSIHLLHGNRNLQQSEQLYRSMNLLKPSLWTGLHHSHNRGV